MGKLIDQLKYWGQIFLIPIYVLSYLVPRDDKIWVLGSTFGRRFADNPKYFYLYLNQCKSKEITAVWISKNKKVIQSLNRKSERGNKKLRAYYCYSLKGIWYALRGKVYLYDNYSKDINFCLSGGAVKINLWHGVPLKKIQMDNKFDRVRNPKGKMEKYKWFLRRLSDEKPEDYIVSPSRFMRHIFASAFQTRNVLICGYPRNDVLKNPSFFNRSEIWEGNSYQLIKKATKGKKLILYMPTFRESETEFLEVINLMEWNQFLSENNMIFCIKLHPKSHLMDRLKRIDRTELDHIILLDKEVDPYPILNQTDILVTDYSSIYFDFLIKDKPIVFFSFDYETYLSQSREMYFDYEIVTPGVKVKTQKELEAALLREDTDSEIRKSVRNKMMPVTEKLYSELLYNNIQDILE